jgi:hypothetical protein
MWIALAGCSLFPASRESVEGAIGYALPPGASGLRLQDVNVGLRDSRTRATFQLPSHERPQLQAVLPCTLEDCGNSWRCFSQGGHDAQEIVLIPQGAWDEAKIDTMLYDNNLPPRQGGCSR